MAHVLPPSPARLTQRRLLVGALALSLTGAVGVGLAAGGAAADSPFETCPAGSTTIKFEGSRLQTALPSNPNGGFSVDLDVQLTGGEPTSATYVASPGLVSIIVKGGQEVQSISSPALEGTVVRPNGEKFAISNIQFCFVKPVTPSTSATATASATPSATASATATPTASATATPTASATATPTRRPTDRPGSPTPIVGTPTPEPGSSGGVTPTATATATATASATSTPTTTTTTSASPRPIGGKATPAAGSGGPAPTSLPRTGSTAELLLNLAAGLLLGGAVLIVTARRRTS